jgi:protein disulfide-isomerase A6
LSRFLSESHIITVGKPVVIVEVLFKVTPNPSWSAVINIVTTTMTPTMSLSLYLIVALTVVSCEKGTGSVIEIIESKERLNTLISESSVTNAVVLSFYSSKDKKGTKTFSSAFDKVSQAFKVLPVSFASVDVDTVEDVLSSQGLKKKDLPAVRLFVGKVSLTYKDGFGKDVSEAAQNVIHWVFEEVKRMTLESVGLKYTKPRMEQKSSSSGSGPLELTDANFKAKVLDVSPDTVVLVEFFAPWCGHCKQLAPIYQEVAKAVHGDPDSYGERTFVAAVDATVHNNVARDYGIQGFPTIKLFVGGKLKSDYNGPRDAASLKDFIRSNLPPKVVESSLRQLTDWENDYDSECLSSPLCVLSFVPNLYDCDAKCRKGYLETLRNEAEKETGTGFGRG